MQEVCSWQPLDSQYNENLNPGFQSGYSEASALITALRNSTPDYVAMVMAGCQDSYAQVDVVDKRIHIRELSLQ